MVKTTETRLAAGAGNTTCATTGFTRIKNVGHTNTGPTPRARAPPHCLLVVKVSMYIIKSQFVSLCICIWVRVCVCACLRACMFLCDQYVCMCALHGVRHGALACAYMYVCLCECGCIFVCICVYVCLFVFV